MTSSKSSTCTWRVALERGAFGRRLPNREVVCHADSDSVQLLSAPDQVVHSWRISHHFLQQQEDHNHHLHDQDVYLVSGCVPSGRQDLLFLVVAQHASDNVVRPLVIRVDELSGDVMGSWQLPQCCCGYGFDDEDVVSVSICSWTAVPRCGSYFSQRDAGFWVDHEDEENNVNLNLDQVELRLEAEYNSGRCVTLALIDQEWIELEPSSELDHAHADYGTTRSGSGHRVENSRTSLPSDDVEEAAACRDGEALPLSVRGAASLSMTESDGRSCPRGVLGVEPNVVSVSLRAAVAKDSALGRVFRAQAQQEEGTRQAAQLAASDGRKGSGKKSAKPNAKPGGTTTNSKGTSTTQMTQQLGYASRCAALRTRTGGGVARADQLPTTFHKKVRSAGYGQTQTTAPGGRASAGNKNSSNFGLLPGQKRSFQFQKPDFGAPAQSSTAKMRRNAEDQEDAEVAKKLDVDYLDNLVCTREHTIGEPVLDLFFLPNRKQICALTSDNVVTVLSSSSRTTGTGGGAAPEMSGGGEFSTKIAFSLHQSEPDGGGRESSRPAGRSRTAIHASSTRTSSATTTTPTTRPFSGRVCQSLHVSSTVSARGGTDDVLLATMEDTRQTGLFSLSTGQLLGQLGKISTQLMLRDACFVAQDAAIAASTSTGEMMNDSIAIFRYDIHHRDPSDDVSVWNQRGANISCAGVIHHTEVGVGAGGRGGKITKYTRLAAPTSVLSSLLLASTSCPVSRELHLFDLSAEKIVAKFGCTSSTSSCGGKVTSLGWATPAGDAASVANLSLFHTVASDGWIDVYDCRVPPLDAVARLSSGAVISLSGLHKQTTNSCAKLKGKFSPCMRYFACGSEEGLAVLYDVRKAGSAAREGDDSSILLSHNPPNTRVTTCVGVDFHPASGALITGGLDGRICLFKSADSLDPATRRMLLRAGGNAAKGQRARKGGRGMKNFYGATRAEEGEEVNELSRQPEVEAAPHLFDREIEICERS